MAVTPTLLGMPRELRDKILMYVLSHHESAPQNVSDATGRAPINQYAYGGGSVMYLTNSKSNCTALLVLNRQVHRETFDAIRLLPSRHSYVLDLVIVREEQLWPTWLYVPVLDNKLDQVYTCIRMTGLPALSNHRWPRQQGRGELFRGGCGGPPAITMAFWDVLERFLRNGPKWGRAGPTHRKSDKRISIKELVIDIRSPDLPAGQEAPSSDKTLDEQLTSMFSSVSLHHNPSNGRALGSDRGDAQPRLLDPQYLLKYIAWDIEMILKMNYDASSYGALIIQRIGTIKLMLDGELHKEWDLAKILTDVQFNDSFRNFVSREIRPLAFRKWKQKAYNHRKEFGLPVQRLRKEDREEVKYKREKDKRPDQNWDAFMASIR